MLNVVVYPSYHNGIYIFFNTTYKYFVHFVRVVRLASYAALRLVEEEEALSDFFFLLVTISSPTRSQIIITTTNNNITQ